MYWDSLFVIHPIKQMHPSLRLLALSQALKSFNIEMNSFTGFFRCNTTRKVSNWSGRRKKGDSKHHDLHFKTGKLRHVKVMRSLQGRSGAKKWMQIFLGSRSVPQPRGQIAPLSPGVKQGSLQGAEMDSWPGCLGQCGSSSWMWAAESNPRSTTGRCLHVSLTHGAYNWRSWGRSDIDK